MRGGRREGAGRKSAGRRKTETITLRVSTELKEEIKKRAAREQIPIGEMLERILLKE